LTPAQLAAFVARPTTAVEIARQYTLDARDLARLRRRRGAHNRLGFAVQRCYLRYPGQAMAPETVPPAAVLAFVAQQVGVPSASWGEYARRDETRREHARELQAAFGYRPFTVTEYRRCRSVLMALALQTNKAVVLAQALLEALRADRIIVPAARVIDRCCAEARARGTRLLYRRLTAGLAADQCRQLDRLLQPRAETRMLLLTGLRQPPGAAKSDGQHYKVGGRGEHTGQVNLRYGTEPGVTFYTHISDQYAPFHTTVIAATVRDATHVLDGLLYHESDLRIAEHYTDTNGFTDHVFALCHLLGFRFAPRLRDLKDKNLYVPEHPKAYPALTSFIGERLNTKLVLAQWPEILRLAASIKQGTVTASLMLRKLACYPRQNGLALALRELGRIERTLFTLDWLLDPALRQQVTAGLNKGEAKNTLARAVCFNRLGEIRDHTYDQQRHRASGLNLVVAAIILWNTVYLARAVGALREQGQDIDHALLKHIAPVHWGHINLTGDYSWRQNKRVEKGGFRPLRPTSRA